MAKSVADLIVDLKIGGIEGVNQLKSALRGLSKSAGPADKDLEQIRRSVTAFAKAGQLSRQSIAGQIEAFKGLRQQATIGSSVYRKLGKDIDGLTQSLDKLNRKEGEIAAKPATTKQLSAQFTSNVPEKTSRQLQAQQEMLQKNKISSAEYTNALVRLNSITQEFTRSQQRQVVIAGSVVAANKAAAGAAISSQKVDISRTFTTAALKQKIAELAQDIENLEIGSKDYTTTSRQLKDAQEELNQVLGASSKAFDDLTRAQERSERRAQKIAGMQSASAGAVGTRDPRTGAMIAGGAGAPASLVQRPVREISGLYQSIGSVGMAGISADIDRMGKSYGEVANDIKKATLASNGSIRSLEAQRNSWASLRAGLDPASKGYREVGREIDKVDKRLARLNKRRGFNAKGAAQSLGAVAAGGIFGGPEGAIGGAIGAIGGPGGAAAGAAIGAQAGILRQSIGATADYASGLQKLEIALQGVAGAGYTEALKAAGEVTKELNVPQEVAIKGITRLSAAVIGAGGNVADAEVVFRNVTSAIKATGGGADDVQSAITAMVQVFSKGKVSAEELSGQLGERLPGAVTKFAEANFEGDMIALQKALKDGTVGLNELMKFILELGDEYSDTAKKIADSSADAGARSQVAFNEIRIAVGEALQPVGAELQLAFAKFVTDILPLLKAGAIAAANGIKFLLDASAFLVKNFKELSIIAGAAGLVLALQNLIGIAGALGTAYAKLTGVVKALNVVMLLNPWVALAAGFAAAAVAINRAVTANSRFNKSVMEGKTPRKEAEDKLRGLNEKVKDLSERLEKEGNGRMIRQLKNQLKAAKIAADDLSLAMKLATSYEVSGITYDRMTGLPISGHEQEPDLTKFAPLVPEGSSGSGTGKEDISGAMMEARINGMRQVITLADVEAKLANDLLQISLEDLKANEEIVEKAQAHFNAEQSRLGIEQQLQTLQENIAAQLDKARLATGEITQEQLDQKELERRRVELQRELLPLLIAGKKTQGEIAEIIEAIVNGMKAGQNKSKSFVDGLKELVEEATNLNDTLADYGVQAVDKFANTFADFVATGKASFREFANSVLQDLARIFARAAFFQALEAVFPGLGKTAKVATSANGNVIAKNKIVPYAYGGIVNKPTLFPMANGAGLMGEAGPEAIMPLRRGANGKLGVEASGGTSNVVVNVDASGSSVEGDGDQAAQLGKMLGAAVQAELVKQKRPGGLLAS